MNKLEYYNRQNEAWTEKEFHEIINEYEIKELTISQIADNHRRTPGSIAYKLQSHNIIINNKLARGYPEYRNSNLFNEIVETNVKIKAENILKKQEEKKSKQVKTTTAEIDQLKNEIIELKKDVQEILRLMNAIYDFENA